MTVVDSGGLSGPEALFAMDFPPPVAGRSPECPLNHPRLAEMAGMKYHDEPVWVRWCCATAIVGH